MGIAPSPISLSRIKAVERLQQIRKQEKQRHLELLETIEKTLRRIEASLEKAASRLRG